MRAQALDDRFELLATRGGGRHGLSAVSQLDHALQCAALVPALATYRATAEALQWGD